MYVAIGLEIHIQLKTKTKMFCGCALPPDGAAPNTFTCPICWGYPGTLPNPNTQAIAMTVVLGEAFRGTIAALSRFDRKHYFYPDLPKGFQISQYDLPIVLGGEVPALVRGRVERFALQRIHLEEDAGKLLHTPEGTIVDLNRAGTPLLEIVTQPVFHTVLEADAFLRGLQLVVRRLGISDADMEKGQLRCDANVSISFQEGKLGTPVEVKNLNSFRFVQRALHYEIERHTALLASNQKVIRETRGWDERRGVTLPQRSKEEAPDYRYFPEPDLLPFNPRKLPKRAQPMPLPTEEFETLCQAFTDLNRKDLEVLVNRSVAPTSDWVAVFKQATKYAAPQKILSWMVHRAVDPHIGGEKLGKFVAWAESSGIPARTAEDALAQLVAGEPLEEVLTRYQTEEFSDEALTAVVRGVAKRNPQALSDLKAGKVQAQGFLIGAVVRELKGKVNPRRVAAVLATILKGD